MTCLFKTKQLNSDTIRIYFSLIIVMFESQITAAATLWCDKFMDGVFGSISGVF